MTHSVLWAAAAALTLFAGSAFVSADDKKEEKKVGLNHELDCYFKVHVSLAADKLDDIKTNAQHLAKVDDKDTAKAAEALSKAKEIADVRKAFGDLSKVLIDRVEAATKKGEKVTHLFIFECPMAKPYGKWMQEAKEISNPYMGAAMPKCGKLLGQKGEDTKSDKDSKDDHKEQDHDHK